MLDIAVAYNRFKFIGNEFLTWLWFSIDTDQDFFSTIGDGDLSLSIGNRIVLENAINDGAEIITIKGDDAGLEEGLLALRKGAMVIEMNLSCKSDGQEWKFSLKGESLCFSGLKLPQTGPMESQTELEGLVLEKTFLIEKAVQLIHRLYILFLKQRLSEVWEKETVTKIRTWLQQ